jgi:hypothetical protein
MARGTTWSDPDRRALAKRYYIDEGLSASQTAKLMGGGLTRMSVLGIAHREGWKRSKEVARQNHTLGQKLAKAAKPKAKPAAPNSPRLKSEPLPPPPQVDVTNARPWETRKPGECAWPLEVDGVTFSCCAPVGHDSPNWQYCPGHRRSLSIPTDKAKQRKLHGWILKAVA